MIFFVFFFKQKTAYEMRISDWSSDVCSSDLLPVSGHYIGHNEGVFEGEVMLNYGIVIEGRRFVYDYRIKTGPERGDGSFGRRPVQKRGNLLLLLPRDDDSVGVVSVGGEAGRGRGCHDGWDALGA